ncbi:MAG: glycosyltransferase family 9 protein [Ignavibacteriae bacterium]|nr:glycosyltransferase family 9 protein [Ignavibacteriota bacterium]NOG96632.1 glycosyltransferase family 9 protein [Ignavibacteriota bacterium]
MERILIIQTAFLGDAILTLPMLQKLREQKNERSIDVICIPSTYEVFEHSPSVDNTIVLYKRGEHKSLFGLYKFAKQLKKNNYSKIISPHRSFRSSLLTALLKVKDTVGFDNASLKFIYRKTIHYKIKDHEVQRNLKLIEAETEGENWKILPRIKIKEEQKNSIDSALSELSIKKFIAIAPGSVWQTKQYPRELFIEVIKLLRGKGDNIVLIGGKDDEELCGSITSGFNSGVFSFAGKLSIVESIELLKRADGLICNDSAPTHMAMCADIPVLTIYCSTVPEFGFYPYNTKSDWLSYSELDCKPCGIHGYDKCPIGTFECAHKIVPQKVISAIEELIN